jgi:hypothetical protein
MFHVFRGGSSNAGPLRFAFLNLTEIAGKLTPRLGTASVDQWMPILRRDRLVINTLFSLLRG